MPEDPACRSSPPSADDADRARRSRSGPSWPAQAAPSRASSARVELARKAYWPDFEVSVGRFVNYGASDGFGAMASVTLPFANKAKVRRRRRGGERARSRRRRPIGGGSQDARPARRRAGVAARAAPPRCGTTCFVSTHMPQAEQALR